MGWLGLKKRPGRDDQDGNDPAQNELKPLGPLTPVLNLLVPDVAGVTSFRLEQFLDIEGAAEFVQTLPSISGLHVFWGLHETPPIQGSGEATGEAMVLIRSAEDSETVYVVSFVDLDSAWSFARFEVKRGMNLNLLLIYWAEIVEVEVDESGVRFVPDAPPLPPYQARSFEATVRDEAPDTAVATPPAPSERDLERREEPREAIPSMYARAATQPEKVAVEEPEPEPEREPEPVAVEEPEAEPEPEPVAVEEPEPVAVEVPEPEAEPEPVAFEEPEREPEPEPVAVEEPEPVAVEVPEPEAEPEPVAFEEPEREPEAEPIAVEEPEPVAAAEAQPEVEPALTQEEMDIEREARAFLKASANGKKPTADPEVPETESAVPPAVAKIVVEVSTPAQEPAEEPEPASARVEEEAVAAVPHVEPELQTGGASADTEEGQDAEAEEESPEDLVEEVEKILNVKRWDKRNSPFRGFDSPPGRF